MPHRGEAAGFGTDGAERHTLPQRIGMTCDFARVLTQEVRSRDPVDVACRGIGAMERLAQANQSFICVQLEPKHIRVGRGLQSFDTSDSHVLSASHRLRCLLGGVMVRVTPQARLAQPLLCIHFRPKASQPQRRQIDRRLAVHDPVREHFTNRR